MLKTNRFWSPFLITLSIWLLAFGVWWAVPVQPISPMKLAQLTESGRKYFRPDYDLPIYLAFGLLSVFVPAAIMRRSFLQKRVETHDRISELDRGSPAWSWGWSDIAAIAIIVSLILVVDPENLMERAFASDGFHHVDYYLMSPLQGFLHGKALGTDAFTQYGGGWVCVYALIERLHHVDYEVFFATFPFFGCVYFFFAYIVLRSLTNDRWWSLIGLLAGIWLVFYCGVGIPRWITPSSTVLRCPLDMLVAIAVLNLEGRRGRLWGVVAGAAGGLSILFGADTGVYVIAGLIVVSSLFIIKSLVGRKSLFLSNLMWVWGACCISFFFGLGVVSRGTVTDSRFWSGYFEAVLAYGGGFSALPLSPIFLRQPLSALVFLAVLVTYSLTLAISIAKAFSEQSESRDLMRAFLATVGFGTLMIFVNRSDPFNLYHPILPACWLVIGLLAQTYPLEEATEKTRARFARQLAAVMASGIILALLLNPNVREYPSIIGKSFAVIRGRARSSSAVSKLVAEIREMGAAVRRRDSSTDLVIVGEDPTLWLLTLGVAPVGRYCPAIPITQVQSERIRRDIVDTGSKTILVTRVPHSLGIAGDKMAFEEILRTDFELRESTDLYALYAPRTVVNMTTPDNHSPDRAR